MVQREYAYIWLLVIKNISLLVIDPAEPKYRRKYVYMEKNMMDIVSYFHIYIVS
jgi:KaiC/GvpD/RAD55 family RecA-like ATPase